MQFSIHSILKVSAMLLVGMAIATPAALAQDDPIAFVTPLKVQPRDPDKSAVLTFRGHGKSPVEILDRTGEVVETIEQEGLFLNQSSPRVNARRSAALQRRRELARAYRAEQKEQARFDAEQAALASEEAAKEQRLVELENTIERLVTYLSTPRRDRYTGAIVRLM